MSGTPETETEVHGGTPETEVHGGESSVLPGETVVEMTGGERIVLAFPSSLSALTWSSEGLSVLSLLFQIISKVLAPR